MDEWQESGPGSDPRYVDRDSSWLGRNKLRIAAIFLLVGIIITAVELFRPREPKLPLEVAALVEPLPQPEMAANSAERQAGDYLPEKSPAALDLSPDEAPIPGTPPVAPAESGPLSPPERHNPPTPAAPAPPPATPPPVTPPPPVAAPAAAKPAKAVETSPAQVNSPAAKNEGSPETWWVINAASTTEASDAERVLKKLRDSGHKVYGYQAEVDGRIWHRVRIGFFSSQAEARKTGEALAKKHNLPTPWVVRPGPDELKTHKN